MGIRGAKTLSILKFSRSEQARLCWTQGRGREAEMGLGWRVARSCLPAWLLLVNIHINEPEPPARQRQSRLLLNCRV